MIKISMSVISQGTWTVITKTGDDSIGTGTASDVYLTITGSAGTSRELEITDKLLRNQPQTFTFTNVGNVGVVSSIHVRLGTGRDSWEFESITLLIAQSQYSFVYGKWLSNYGTNPTQDVTLLCSGDTSKFYIHMGNAGKIFNILVLGHRSQNSHCNCHTFIIYKN